MNDQSNLKEIQTTGFMNIENLFPVWVGNLSMNIIEKDLIDLFTPCGQLVSIKLCQASGGRMHNKKFAFVNFKTRKAQMMAADLHGTMLKDLAVDVKVRDTQEARNRKLFIGSVSFNSEEEFRTAVAEFGEFDFIKVQVKPENHYAFLFFRNAEEANKFYDNMQGKSLSGEPISVEFPRTKEERDAICAGVDKKIIERAKRTVFLGSLELSVTEDQIRKFCNTYGEISKINMPKSKGGKALAFVEFTRKTVCDFFLKKFRGQEHGETFAGSTFVVEISKINVERRTQIQTQKFGQAWGSFSSTLSNNYIKYKHCPYQYGSIWDTFNYSEQGWRQTMIQNQNSQQQAATYKKRYCLQQQYRPY